MADIHIGIDSLIGNTPLFLPQNFNEEYCRDTKLLVKLEYFNPAGSVKDRVARAMIEDAEEKGWLRPGSVIIEPTSGNTGIGLAAIAAAKGYRIILTMPETMSLERRNLLKAYGADLVLTDSANGMQGAIDKAEALAKETPGSFIPGQFVNPINPRTHYLTTGPEIWAQSGGVVDLFIAGAGTGGTITGVGRYLKEKNPDVYIIAVEPAGAPMLSKGEKGAHGLQGIGAGFVPDILDTAIYDEVMTITEQEAYSFGRAFARKEGVLVGISSGAALAAAVKAANREANKGKTIIAVLPDTGERYLSTPLFE